MADYVAVTLTFGQCPAATVTRIADRGGLIPDMDRSGTPLITQTTDGWSITGWSRDGLRGEGALCTLDALLARGLTVRATSAPDPWIPQEDRTFTPDGKGGHTVHDHPAPGSGGVVTREALTRLAAAYPDPADFRAQVLAAGGLTPRVQMLRGAA